MLTEIQAYIGSDIATAEGVYSQLYETKGKGYENLPKISFSEFSGISEMIVNLYGFFEGNHDKVCEAVGKSKSIKDFQEKARRILLEVSFEELNHRVNNWMEMKKEWARGTIRIAKEILKK